MSDVRLVRVAAHLPNGVIVTSGPELVTVTGAVAWEAEYAIETQLRTDSAVYLGNRRARGVGATRALAFRRAKAAARRALVP